METALRKKELDRLRRAFQGHYEDTVMISSPGLQERVTVSLTPQKILNRKYEHGPTAPVILNYWRARRGHGESSRNYDSFEEFVEELHG